jgi:hypothetical protein
VKLLQSWYRRRRASVKSVNDAAEPVVVLRKKPRSIQGRVFFVLGPFSFCFTWDKPKVACTYIGTHSTFTSQPAHSMNVPGVKERAAH